jgi:hypothetical protein
VEVGAHSSTWGKRNGLHGSFAFQRISKRKASAQLRISDQTGHFETRRTNPRHARWRALYPISRCCCSPIGESKR